MAKKQPASININGKTYTEDQLTDQQKALVNHVINLDQKIANQVFQLEQLQGGKAYFMAQLEAALKMTEKEGGK